MQHINYTQGFAGAFPGSVGPFVTPPTAIYEHDAPATYGANPYDGLGQESEGKSGTLGKVMYVAGVAASMAGAYHGYKRNNSVGWAIGWAVLTGVAWPIAVPVMLAQGFGKPKKA